MTESKELSVDDSDDKREMYASTEKISRIIDAMEELTLFNTWTWVKVDNDR